MTISTVEGWETSSDADIIHSGNEPPKSLSPFQSLPSAATQETKREIQHADVLYQKKGSVAAYPRSL